MPASSSTEVSLYAPAVSSVSLASPGIFQGQQAPHIPVVLGQQSPVSTPAKGPIPCVATPSTPAVMSPQQTQAGPISPSPSPASAQQEQAPPQAGTSSSSTSGIFKWSQNNPKRPGSAAHARYESYKSATSRSEAISKGAFKEDISHDIKKGFLKTETSLAETLLQCATLDKEPDFLELILSVVHQKTWTVAAALKQPGISLSLQLFKLKLLS